MAFHKI